MNLEERVIRLEAQFERFISDAESEKRTRANANSEIKEWLRSIDQRLRVTERSVWIGIGGLLVMQFLARFIPTP